MALRELFQQVVADNKEAQGSTIKAAKQGFIGLQDPDNKELTKENIAAKRKAAVEPKEESDDSEEGGFNSLTDAFKKGIRGESAPEPKKKKKKLGPANPAVKISIPNQDEEEEKTSTDEEEVGEGDKDGENKGKEKKPKEEKENKRTQDGQDDGEINEEGTDELLGVDPEQLVSASGQTIGKKAAEHIKRLKQHLAFYAEKAKKTEENLKKVNPQLEKEHEELREAHKNLKKRFTDLYFEESEEFQETYVQPLKKAETEMVKWIKSHDIGDEAEAAETLNPIIGDIQKSLGTGDEVKYYEAVDRAAEFLKPGARARFLAAAPALYEAYLKKQQAVEDKDKAREEVKKSSLTFAQQQTVIAEKAIDSFLTEFETSNKKIVDAYKNDDRYKDYIDYDNTVVANVKSAKQAISTAVQQRKVTDELVKLAFAGSLAPLRDKEQQGFLARIAELEKANENLQNKIKQKEESISRFKPSRQAVRSVTEDDDDDDTSEAASMVDVFRKRMGR